MITCDEIIIAAGSAPTNVPTIVMSTVSTNVTRTASINVHNKKVRYKMNCYILYMVLLVVILLFIITVIGYHYAKNKSRQKKYWPTNNAEMEKDESKKHSIINHMCYYFNDINRFEEFYFDNI